MNYKKTIEIFLANGSVDSLITAELSNWNGKAIKIPRIEVNGCERKDIKGAGVYFLFCKEDNDADSVYIGESETVQVRLKKHIQDYKKGTEKFFWNTAVIFLGQDLNKASIRYLEDYFVNLAKESKRYVVLTKNTNSNTVMKESQKAAMEEFIDNVRILINALGYKVLEPTVQKGTSSSENTNLFHLSTKGGADATGVLTTEGFVLLAGATVIEKTSENSLSKGAIELRKKLFKEKVKNLTTTEDILFNSPSAAAVFVTGYSISGPANWKNSEGKTLQEMNT